MARRGRVLREPAAARRSLWRRGGACGGQARLVCAPCMLASPARLASSPRQLASPARLACSPRVLASPARLACSPRPLASPAHLACSPRMLASPARFACSPPDRLATGLARSPRLLPSRLACSPLACSPRLITARLRHLLISTHLASSSRLITSPTSPLASPARPTSSAYPLSPALLGSPLCSACSHVDPSQKSADFLP